MRNSGLCGPAAAGPPEGVERIVREMGSRCVIVGQTITVCGSTPRRHKIGREQRDHVARLRMGEIELGVIGAKML